MHHMSALIRAGRAPADMMPAYASRDARRGPNDPCTCGSGRKWKRCHGNAVVLGEQMVRARVRS
jgi:uncharacterized protein